MRQNFVGNEITLEALIYGVETGTAIITVIMFFSCMFAVFSTDKIIYLFGRISPKLSLFISILLRMVPKIKQYGKCINIAQMSYVLYTAYSLLLFMPMFLQIYGEKKFDRFVKKTFD